jgi:hypothetical protein
VTSHGNIAVLLATVVTTGCWGSNSQIGNDEPFRVQNAQFIEGRLLGSPIEDAGPNPPAAPDDGPPSTTSPRTTQGAYFPGQTGASFTGDATTKTASIALSLEGVGSGYWVFPVAGPDPATGRLTWAATADFGRGLAPGRRNLRAVAIDAHGRAGEQTVVPLCIKGLVPDNLQSCSPKREPPQAVISLSWDVNADLDLQVIGPDGRVLEPKRATTSKLMDGGEPVTAAASFDHDSNANCTIDGFRIENLVWETERPMGAYQIYANLFDSCKQPAVHFGVGVFESEPGADGGPSHLEEKLTARGELLDISANGGSQRGLFVTQYVFR